MESLKELYKIGHGPSSSHTMGPGIAAKQFLEKNKTADTFKVTLYGSLALTGRGHLIDKILNDTFIGYHFSIVYNYDVIYNYHPNGMLFEAYLDGKKIDKWLVFSVGGGDLKNLGEERSTFKNNIYPEKSMDEIISFCNEHNFDFIDYALYYEPNIKEYLQVVLKTMLDSVKRGLTQIGELPGELHVLRKANAYYTEYLKDKSTETLCFAGNLAVAEENASGGIVVTAPTCGSSGVIPGILYAFKESCGYDNDKLINGLIIAGIIGNLCKTNGSISGAEVGCQGEVGVACAMAAAMCAYWRNASIRKIEYAAEIALEHHLGMTCDPINGLVQIPCIERNALAASHARSAANYAILSDGVHHISLDDVIKVMVKTGKDLSNDYKETSLGGLATFRKDEGK